MSFSRSPLTRGQVAVLVLALTAVVLLVGVVRVVDYHPLSPTPSQASVPENAPPRRVFDRASAHLEHSTVTVRMHTNVTEATGTAPDSAPVRYIFRSDAERNRLHAYMYHYDGNRTWTTSCSYITDGASIAKSGSLHAEDRPSFCTTGDSTWYPFDRTVSGNPVAFDLDDWHGPPPVSEAWNVTSRNESVIVLRTTSFDAFVAMQERPVDEDVENGSYTVHVDATTSRLTRVERVTMYRQTDGDVRREETVYRFSKYGRTDVSPPEALGYPSPGELIRDVIVY